MKCYYEELGVTREAGDQDIKTAYRKLALRWHPDKNPDCLEKAKTQFQLIQQAYEVLSDTQERAWYDRHREEIIHGKNSNYQDNCVDLFPYFTVSCFKGYGDDEKGFYAVYRQIFAKIAVEDAEFMDAEEVSNIPRFGDSQSNYDAVVAQFYAYWQAYSTKRSYAWLCPYDLQDIKDRRSIREIGKGMKKIVQNARRERNEEVRNLVAFVRKRDKRVEANKLALEERVRANRQKNEMLRLEQLRKRQQEVKAMQASNSNHFMTEDYEEQLSQLEHDYSDSDLSEDEFEDEIESDGEISDGDGDGEAAGADQLSNLHEYDEIIDELYCVACNKSFKNENALTNHQASKKHRECVERLREELLADERAYHESEENIRVSDEEDGLDDDRLENDLDDLELSAGTEESEPEILNVSKKSKKNKKAKKFNTIVENTKSDEEENVDLRKETIKSDSIKSSDDEHDNWNNTKKGARRAKNKKQTKQTANKLKSNDTNTAPIAVPEKVSTENVTTPKPSSSQTNADAATEPSTSLHVCATCNSTFESKNKLFAHLKKTNHSVYLPKPKVEPDIPTKKGKGKRK